MTKPKLRIGLIGTGFMGKAHVFGFTSAPRVFELPVDLELHTVADITREPPPNAPARRWALPMPRQIGGHHGEPRDRPGLDHRAECAAQGNVAGGDRRGQACLLRESRWRPSPPMRWR
jgi:hypothetical protein